MQNGNTHRIGRALWSSKLSQPRNLHSVCRHFPPVYCRHMAKAVEGAVERVSVADCQRTNKRCMHEKMLKSTLCSVNARWCTRTVTHLGMCSLAREANACRIYVCNCILCSASVALAATSVCGLFISCQRQASPHPPTRVTDERVTKKKRTNATVQRSAQRA